MFPGLTQRKAENLTTPGEYRAGLVPGLFLVVSQGKLGLHKNWVLRYTLGKKVFRRGLGLFIDTPLEKARAKAIAYRQALQQGKDPLLAKQEKRQACCSCLLLVEEWEKTQRSRQVHKEEEDYLTDTRLLKQAFSWSESGAAEIGRKSPDRITSRDLAMILNDLTRTFTGKAARTRYLFGSFFGWCRSMGWIAAGAALPTDRSLLAPLLAKPRRLHSVQPALPFQEIPRLLQALCEDDSPVALALAFSILTATRSANVRTMHWSELSADGTMWTIPSARMKISTNGLLRVPLSSAAQRILARIRKVQRAQSSGLVFLKDRGFPLQASDFPRKMRQLDVLDRRQGGSGFRDPLQTDAQGNRRIATQHGTARAGFRTWGEERKFAGAVLEAALHHRTESYKRTDYFVERVDIMQQWGEFCCPGPKQG